MLRKLRNVLGLVIIFSLFMVPCSYGQEKDPEKLSELLKKADMLHSEGYYSQAAVVVENILSLNQETSGKTSADIAESLDHLGELYYLAGKYKESEPFLQTVYTTSH
jgi:tetratricopeptide (TPR) repeat protein